MSLGVSVLPVGVLPVVRLTVEAAGPWRVEGRAEGKVWLAGEGVGPSTFADPWAPLGVTVSYTLTGGGEAETGGPVVRSYDGENAVTDLTGRTVASFAWHPSPGNPRRYEPRADLLEPWGAPLPVPVVGPVAGAGGGSLAARTTPPHSGVMRTLVEANRPLLLVHSHSRGRCGVVDCDIPLVQTVLLTAAAEDRYARSAPERIWDLTYRLVPRPHGFLAPVATWADVAERWSTVGALADSGLDNGDLLRGDWLVGW